MSDLSESDSSEEDTAAGQTQKRPLTDSEEGSSEEESKRKYRKVTKRTVKKKPAGTNRIVFILCFGWRVILLFNRIRASWFRRFGFKRLNSFCSKEGFGIYRSLPVDTLTMF